jgi:chromosomal replication initiation ATPase DnaA
MYLCREMTKAPTTGLATLFHCKHHSAITHAHARMGKTLESDRQALAIVAGIKRVIEYSL